MTYNQARNFAASIGMDVDWYYRGYDNTYYVQTTIDGYNVFEEDLDPKDIPAMEASFIKAITECAAFHGKEFE